MVPPEDKTEAAPPAGFEPAWEVAHLFPYQGCWSEDDYLKLDTNRLVEFADGSIEVLPMPTTSHQAIVLHLYRMLLAFATAGNLGPILVAPLRVRLRPGKIREPDVVFLLTENAHRIGEEFWDGADLVMEVVSANERTRDLVVKRQEYAEAGIAEYWIVDPREARITVLTLREGAYAVRGEFGRGERATSALLPGFEVDVAAALDARP